MRQIYFLLALLALGGLARSAHAAAPSITQQPTNQTAQVNHFVTFSVTATGTAPLHYQWRQGNSNSPNATNFFFDVTGAQPVSNLQFSVVITNSFGSVTSSTAGLTLLPDNTPPTLVLATNTPAFTQISVQFSERMAANTATNPANYALDQGASVLSGVLQAGGSNVLLTVTALTEGATYMLTVSDITDLATNLMITNPTNLTFQAAVAPMITAPPQSRSVLAGDAAMFSVTASGTDPKSYQWLKNGAPLVGETSSTLTINNVQAGNLGGYRVVVANSAGTVTSGVAVLSFSQNYTLNLPAGYSFIANPLYSPTPTFPDPPDGTIAYKWNAVSQTYGSISTYDLGAGGWVDVNSTPVTFTLALGEGAVINLPSPATLNFVGAAVTPVLPVALQPGLNLLGAQAPIPGGYAEIVGPPQEGGIVYRFKPGHDPSQLNEQNYQISYFHNGMWNDNPPPVFNIAEAGFFSLVAPVIITTQPVGRTNVALGQSVTFDVAATGTGPLQYQWRLNGTAIPDATNSTYQIQSVNPGHAGRYSASVGNAVGDISSVNVPLALNTPFLLLTDSFAAQTNVSDFSRLLSSQNRNATIETNEPAHAGKRAGGSVWLTWTAPTNGIVTFSTAGSGFDTILAAYRGTNLANLLLVDASDDDAGYACSRIRFNAQQGVPYRICVAGLGPEKGNILLGWNLEVTAQVAPEISAQPQDQTVGYGDTAQFTVTATNGSFSYQWYHNGALLVGASAATLTINNAGDDDVGSYYVHVYNGGNPSRFRDSLNASLQIEVPEPGQPLTGARVSGKFFDLTIPGGGGAPLKGPSPKLGGTVAHGYSGAQTFSTAGLGKDPDEPNHCGIAGGNSVWYAIQATNNGTMYINTDGSSFNTVLAAYIGPGVDFITLTNVACDNNSGLDGLDSSTSFAATSGTIYYIAVDGVGAASGTVKFHYQLVRPLTLTNLVYSTNGSGSFTMKVNTTPSLTNVIHYRTNLTSTNWVAALTNTSASGTFNYTNTGIGTLTNRYYRALNKF